MGQDLAKQVQPRNSVHSNSSVVQAPQPKDLYSKKGPLNRCKCARLSHFYVIDIKCHPWESAQKYHLPPGEICRQARRIFLAKVFLFNRNEVLPSPYTCIVILLEDRRLK